MEILINRGENTSGSCNLNFVAKFENIYIIDNHLAAFWCWNQLPNQTNHQVLHIDRHYDLRPYYEDNDQLIHTINWNNVQIEEITNFHYTENGSEHQLIRWDNYINLFRELKPNFFEELIFITQKEDTFSYEGEFREMEIFKLANNDINNFNNPILNLDIDFFFSELEGITKRTFTNDFINHIAEWVKEEQNKFDQIILCLSPECCGSWKEAKEVANIFLSKFEIEI
jgi:hypothetical protein